eukprot:UN06994
MICSIWSSQVGGRSTSRIFGPRDFSGRINDQKVNVILFWVEC